MSVVVKPNSFPAPQHTALSGMGSEEPNPRWPSVFTRAAHTDVVRRSGALLAFLFAVILVMVSAGGALAQVDSDNDGIGDEVEVSVYGTDPNNGDTDLDGLPDGVEVSLGTNPLEADSDGDGANDAEEYLSGGDPLVSASVPVAVVVTQVPTSVVSGSNSSAVTVGQAPGTVTVSPVAVVDVAPAALAFDSSVVSDRSPLFPFYMVIVSAIGVWMAVLVKRLPKLG